MGGTIAIGWTKKPVIGPQILVVVELPPNFFRNYGFLKIPSDKESRDKYFRIIKPNNSKYFTIKKILPDDKEPLMWHMIYALNEIPHWWEKKIYLQPNMNPEYKEQFYLYAPKNILKLKRKLNLDKWLLAKNQSSSFANAIAEHINDSEKEEISSIWGSYGTGHPNEALTIDFIIKHPECPHIHRTSQLWKDLLAQGKIQEPGTIATGERVTKI